MFIGVNGDNLVVIKGNKLVAARSDKLVTAGGDIYIYIRWLQPVAINLLLLVAIS